MTPREAAQAATSHVDDITQLTAQLNACLDAAYEGGDATEAVELLDHIISAARTAKNALAGLPAPTRTGPEMTIRPGQIYYRADSPNWVRIQVVRVEGETVHITDEGGKFPRTIRAAVLHASPTTATGKTRRTGYILAENPDPTHAEQTAPEASPGHLAPGQIWESAHPEDTILVAITRVDGGRVWVVDARNGERSRTIDARVFHPNRRTRAGALRRSGYVLHTGVVSR